MFSKKPIIFDAPRSFDSNFAGFRLLIDEERFPSNFIKTSRYNLITFLPKSLLLQFYRYANVYFLCIAIIQSISVLSTLNPFSAIAPLVFVLGLSMAREGWEDYGRHISDAEVNATACKVLKSRQIVDSTWADICVGDYVIIEENDSFPADIIVLGSSIDSGLCYIETSSLDGEKNLKPKSAILESQKMFSSATTYSESIVKCEAKQPTQALSEFDGSIYLEIDNKLPPKKFQLSGKQLLLRGAYLRNTKWVIGLVAYTGQDTKIMRNADASRIKSSEIERTMNILILGILCIQLTLSTITAIFSSVWLHNYGDNSFYLDYSTENYHRLSFYVFFSYILLYNTMIPISLIVSLEFVKVFQAYFMEQDEEMYVASRNKFAKVQTTTINEELGQVEYIFSDKTGTLTCNQMEFKYCVIGGTLYGRSEAEKNGTVTREQQKQSSGQNKVHPSSGEAFQHSIFTFHDEELSAIIEGTGNTSNDPVNLPIKSLDGKAQINMKTQKDIVENYMFLLASAHECLVQYDKNNNPQYQGPSPDEITLVDAAAHLGYKFTGASASEQQFIIKGVPKKVALLNSFEFDSDRKRMTVVIKDDTGVIRVLTKGADAIIKSRLGPQQPYLDQVINYLEEFSKIGLRCLLMGCRILSEEEYRDFDYQFNNLPDGDQKKIELDILTDKLERNLTLLGATAVEDKLQDGVPETIADLLRANIKVWMLTGDKLETAENIAKSCKLIQGDFTVMRLSEDTDERCSSKLKDIQDTYDLCMKQGRKKSILVEGQSLTLLLNNHQMKMTFVNMAKDCESVVCCRVTPKQKALVVEMIKNNLNKITLAIGDGANDVNMIQAAHIGVGLYGNEGMRAVQSADFALGEFQCLWRLLLVHGHWNYVRISEMVLYFFYKNMIFTVPQLFYAFFSAFSGQSFFDDWYITFYNLIFTALPLIIRGTFDQDVNYRQHINYDPREKVKKVQQKQELYLKRKFPLLYYIGQQKTIFTIPNYMVWALTGLVHGFIIFFFVFWIQDYESLDQDGYPGGMAALSLTVYSAIVFIADAKIAMYTKLWTWFNLVSITLLSIVLYVIYMFISHYWTATLMEYTPVTMLGTPHFWLCQILLISIIAGFDALTGEIEREFFHDPSHEMLKQVKAFDNILNGWIESQAKIERQDSFWAGIYKDEEVELVQFSESGLYKPNQQVL